MNINHLMNHASRNRIWLIDCLYITMQVYSVDGEEFIIDKGT